jgi:DNA mismatch repair protein MutL
VGFALRAFGTKGDGIDWSIAHDEVVTTDNRPMTIESETPSADESRPSSMVNGQSAFSTGVPLLRLIGQIGSTYLVAEGPDGLYLIDQHAAHERVLFEKLMAQHDTKSIPSQALLAPEVVTLPPQSAKTLDPAIAFLESFRF